MLNVNAVIIKCRAFYDNELYSGCILRVAYSVKDEECDDIVITG